MAVKDNIRPSDRDTLSLPKASDLRQKPRLSRAEYERKLGLKRLTEFGAEIPDPTPVAPPVGYKPQPSMFENMRQMVKAELARKALDEGFDTEEEDNNFDIVEDNEPFSRHVFTEMDEEFVKSTHADLREKSTRKRMEAVEPKGPEGQGPKAAEGGAEGTLDAPKGPEAKKS